jgi:DNA-binding MurR/RpiR family transcriptional regulator
MTVVDRIIERAERLTATERKIAEILAGEPQTIAFGTVAGVAKRAGTSGPSVVRLAVKLGYQGFVELQAAVQRELADQLGPARDRIRQRPPTNLLERVAGQEQDNVARTLQQVSGEVFDRTVAMLADVDRRVWVLPGEVTFPVGQVLALQLGQLREGVTLLAGSEVSVNRSLAALSVDDPLVVIDIHRYERWLVDTVAWAQAEMGAAVVALTDSPLSPLVAGAAEAFFVAAQGVGPFDSMTASLALANALVVGVAARLREPAAAHLDAIEAAWVANRSLVAEPGRLVLPVADGPRSPEPSLPAVVEPAVVEPAGVEPAGVEPAGVEPAGVAGLPV